VAIGDVMLYTLFFLPLFRCSPRPLRRRVSCSNRGPTLPARSRSFCILAIVCRIYPSYFFVSSLFCQTFSPTTRVARIVGRLSQPEAALFVYWRLHVVVYTPYFFVSSLFSQTFSPTTRELLESWADSPSQKPLPPNMAAAFSDPNAPIALQHVASGQHVGPIKLTRRVSGYLASGLGPSPDPSPNYNHPASSSGVVLAPMPGCLPTGGMSGMPPLSCFPGPAPPTAAHHAAAQLHQLHQRPPSTLMRAPSMTAAELQLDLLPDDEPAFPPSMGRNSSSSAALQALQATPVVAGPPPLRPEYSGGGYSGGGYGSGLMHIPTGGAAGPYGAPSRQVSSPRAHNPLPPGVRPQLQRRRSSRLSISALLGEIV